MRDHHPKLTIILLTLVAVSACTATFFGLRALMGQTGVAGILLPLAFAVAVAVGLAALWHISIHSLPLLKTAGRSTAAMTFFGVVALFAIAVSSWLMTTAISGSTAVRIDLSEQEESARGALRTQYENALVEQQIVPSVNRTAAELQRMADLELKNGAYSGRYGPGPTVEVLTRSAETYQRLAGDANDLHDRIEAKYAAALQLLSDMRVVTGSNTPVNEKHHRVGQIMAQVQQLTVELGTVGILSSVRTMQVANVTVGNTGTSAAAVKEVYAAIEQRNRKLQAEAERLQRQKKDVELMPFRDLGPGEAVIEHAGAVMSGWLVAVTVDLLPLLLIVLLFIRIGATPMQQGPPPAPAE
jgi:hypothetical protein